ncbi:DUF1673 family protein [Methanosarcina sp. KYL-1]|uniref:DUF1673 family protein n=1 Tax=Methanosarcina sp. KYL-1 TaxID=2602068 RepID=UPI00210152FC|nr:DUF1673 family protein [Methanosarcina sp. KYL-1]MCQ1535058.1 DUF1673 family protein [Methanosarcina sp. KYL-1]
MVFPGYFRKLMGWCPMKDALREERQEDGFRSFGLETGSFQQGASPTDLSKSKTLKMYVRLSRGEGIGKIIFPALIASFVLGVYSPADSFLSILSALIPYIALLFLVIYHRTSVELTPEKVVILRPLLRPLEIRKEDIVQTSIKKNESHSLRWPFRLLYIAVVLPHAIEWIARALQNLEGPAPAPAKFSLFLVQLWGIAFLLVLYYNFELLASYQHALKVATSSKMTMWFYIREPEELAISLKK